MDCNVLCISPTKSYNSQAEDQDNDAKCILASEESSSGHLILFYPQHVAIHYNFLVLFISSNTILIIKVTTIHNPL